MDRGDVKETIIELFKKNRWIMLILAVGFLLMCYPEKQTEDLQVKPEEMQQETTLQQELEDMLSKLENAGKVKVLLSISTGSRSYYQTDAVLSKTTDTIDERKEAVIITSANREEQGLLQRIDPPLYLGAVVLCQGADDAKVKLAVVDAVSTATGLSSDKISVLKMK